jgi:hypothetical protein
MTALNPDPHHEDLLMVATAYRQALMAGGGEDAGFQASLDAFLKHHPEFPSDKARDEVIQLIAEAIVEYGGWLYGDE